MSAYASPPITTPWVPLWPLASKSVGELAYVERTAGFAVGTSPVVFLTAPAILLDGVTPIVIDYVAPVVTLPAVVAGVLAADLYMDGVKVNTITQMANAAATANVNVSLVGSIRLTPAAGSHVFDVRLLTNTSTGTVVAGAVMYLRISLAAPISTAPAGALLPVQYGTTLPGSPVDGQEAILVDSLTAPTYQWRFRYNANSSSAYKWEFIGGAEKLVTVATDETSTATSAWADLATVGPELLAPRAGDYDLDAQAHAYGVAGAMYIGIANGATQPVTPFGSILAETAVACTVMTGARLTGVSAGASMRMRYYKTTSGTGTWGNRFLRVLPVRVS